MLNIFAKKAIFLASISAIFSPMVLAEPPGAGIKYLEIRSASDSSATGIYANGNMQAKLKVIYELNDGYKFSSVKFRTRDEELDNYWTVSENENEFEHEILSRAVEETPPLPFTSSRRDYLFRYISASKVEQKRICAVLTATGKNGESSEKSTCVDNPETSGMYVNIIALHPIKFFKSDFYYNTSNILLKSQYLHNANYQYATQFTTLTHNNNNFTLKKVTVNGKDPIDYPIVSSQKPIKERYPTTHYWDSILYMFPLNKGDYTHGALMHAVSTSEKFDFEVFLNKNTRNKINFAILFGKSIDHRVGWDTVQIGAFAKGNEAPLDPTTQNILFYDIHGNAGKIKVERSKGTLNDNGYTIYVAPLY